MNIAPALKNASSILSFLCTLFFLLPCLLIAQKIEWRPTNGPYGGDVAHLLVDIDGTVFAGTHRGLYRSDNNGRTWNLAALEGEIIEALARDLAGGLFAGTRSGLWSSTDRVDWQRIGFKDTAVNAIATQSNGWIFVGVQARSSDQFGLFRSIDDGERWEQLRPPDGGNFDNVIRLDAINDTMVFAASTGALARSTDNGDTWCPIHNVIVLANSSSGDYAGGYGINSFLTFAGRDSVIVADRNGLYIAGECHEQGRSVGVDNPMVRTLHRDIDGAILGGTTFHGLRRSTDSGQTWLEYVPSATHANTIVNSSDGELLIGTSIDGIFRSEGGRSLWSVSAEGLSLLRTRQIVGLRDDVAIAKTTAGLFRTTDAGAAWYRLPMEADESIALTSDSDMVLYAGVRDAGKIVRSTDLGASWEIIEIARSKGVKSIAAHGETIAVSLQGEVQAIIDDVEYLGPPKLFVSTDNGVTWKKVLEKVDVSTLLNGRDGAMLAGAGGLLRSTDRGATWMPLSSTPDTVARRFFGLPDGSVYGLFRENHLWRSDDNGDTWSPFGVGLPAPPDGLVINGERTYFAIASGLLYRSTDGGNVWEQIDDTPPGSLLAIDPEGYLYSVGEYGPVHRSAGRTVSVATLDRSDRFYLHANAPDPFSDRTSLRFSLQQTTHLRLTLTDASGRELRTLYEGEKEGGDHFIEVEGEDLTQGIYFVRLIADETEKVESIIVRR